MSDEKTIYVVTRGNYSDYRIMGVFDDESLAMQYEEWLDGKHFEYVQVEQYTLNEKVDEMQKGLRPWTVLFAMDSADIVNMRRNSMDMLDIAPNVFRNADGVVVVWCHAEDKERAAKVAMEMRSQFLANELHEWVQSFLPKES